MARAEVDWSRLAPLPQLFADAARWSTLKQQIATDPVSRQVLRRHLNAQIMASSQPVLGFQAGYPGKVLSVPREQGRVVRQRDGRDHKVLGSGSNAQRFQSFEYFGGTFVPRQDAPRGMQFHLAHQPGVGGNQRLAFVMTADFCEPPAQLFLNGNGGDYGVLGACRRKSIEQTQTDRRAIGEFTGVIGIENEHDYSSFTCIRHSRPNRSAPREISSSGIMPTVARQSFFSGVRLGTWARRSANRFSKFAKRSSTVERVMDST
jgi:hypothetical protein